MKLTRREFMFLGGSALLLPNLLPDLLRAAPAGTVPVLMYHDITDRYKDPYSTPPALFAAHMEWLYSSGYRAVTLAESVNEKETPEQRVVITFDDGYSSFLDYAFPLLCAYGFTATVNLIAGYAGSYMQYIGPRPMISWDEYRFLCSSGVVDLGCHTSNLHSGQGVLDVSSAALEFDLISFRKKLRQETGIETDIIAWPFGSYTEESIKVAERVGFRYFLTSDEGYFNPSGRLNTIQRLSITKSIDMDLFRNRLGVGA